MRSCLRRLAPLVVALCAACRTAPAPDDRVRGPDRPFIKLAARNLGLIVQWEGAEVPEAYLEQVERRLAKRLRTVYRTKIVLYRLPGPVRTIPPELYMTFVEADVDDVVITRLQPFEREDGPVGANAYVVALADLSIRHEARLEKLASKRKGRPQAKKLADLLVRKISKVWTDPGAAPPLDPMLAADQLADRNACAHAVKLYERYFDSNPQTITGLGSKLESERRWKRCERRIRIQEAIRADRTAKFEIRVENEGVRPEILAAFERAAAKSEMKKLLARSTDKPVTIFVDTNRITVAMRYHEDRYLEAVADRERYVFEQPVVYVDPYARIVDAILTYREEVEAEVEPYERRAIRAMNATLRLEKLNGDYAAIDFSDLEDRLLFTNTLRLRVGSRPEIGVPSTEGSVTQSQRWVLGPPRDATGALTAYGLVFEFFGLGKRDKK